MFVHRSHICIFSLFPVLFRIYIVFLQKFYKNEVLILFKIELRSIDYMTIERLVFFDIECAKRARDYSAICSFGYAIADLNFNVLESRDILVNPEAGFDKRYFQENSDCRLAYSKKEFRSQPNFPTLYESIKKILLIPNALVVGFSVENDIEYLLNTCKRYGLSLINFCAFDIRSYLKNHMGISSSLDGSLSQLGVDISDLTWHKSCDDAIATMRLFKTCFERTQRNVESAIELQDCIESVEKIEFQKKLKVYRKYIFVKMLDYYDRVCESPESNKLEGSFCFKINADYDIDQYFELVKLFFKNGANLRVNSGKGVMVVYPDGEPFIEPTEGDNQRNKVHLNELLNVRGMAPFVLSKQRQNIPEVDAKGFIMPQASSLKKIKEELALRQKSLMYKQAIENLAQYIGKKNPCPVSQKLKGKVFYNVFRKRHDGNEALRVYKLIYDNGGIIVNKKMPSCIFFQPDGVAKPVWLEHPSEEDKGIVFMTYSEIIDGI